jgi:aspartate/methionine/tyrosine aminotransferase
VSGPGPARRAHEVQAPVMPLVTGWIAATPGTISLGQGLVGYGPPPAALARLPELVARPGAHRYVPDAGLPELRAAFAEKLRRENGIDAPYPRRVLVTVGANQAFLQALLCICDPGDEVVLLRPYYFNQEMAVRLVGCRPVIVDCDADHLPRPDAIAAALGPRTRAVVTISPNNPTGAVYPRELLVAVNELCARAGVFHISDEAYEYFTWDGARHFSPGSLGGDHTISLFSLSKAYGFASWRIGFLVVPEGLFDDALKVQDTNAICAPGLSQAVAVELLRIGRGYCDEQRRALARVRALTLDLLGAAGDVVTLPPATGAFYCFPRVRSRLPALALVERLVREHRVAVIPGSTFGVDDPCSLRVSYGAVDEATAAEGIGRLVAGLRALA